MSSIEGISAETVGAVEEKIHTALAWGTYTEATQDAITAILASGEVVLRKDVEELVDAAKMGADYLDICNKMLPVKAVADSIRGTVAKFTTKPGGSDE